MSPATPSTPASSLALATTVHNDALGLVGNTPLVRLDKLSPKGGATVWAKVEFRNPGGSVKDRPALAMIQAEEASGRLKPGGLVIEATSGNTGISLALISALRGYRCVLVMPQDMSIERRLLLKAYGAEIELTEAQLGMAGAVARAEALVKTTPGAFMPRQFSNPANPRCHELGTAPEILAQVSGSIDAFVAGVGTGGTITGVARALKRERGAGVRIVAVEPERSAVLSGGRPGLHGIQGLGAGFIPEVLERALLDEVSVVSDVTALRTAQRLAHETGLLVGPSSGANVHAACQVAARLTSGNVVTVLCDTGERYIS